MARRSSAPWRPPLRGYGGRYATDYNAPRNWEHPHWHARSDIALTSIAELAQERWGEDRCDEWFEAFWEHIPDEWMETTPWRYLALSAESLLAYFKALPPGAEPDVADMVQSYRSREPVIRSQAGQAGPQGA